MRTEESMNDNKGTIPRQNKQLESMASTMRDDLKEARAGLQAMPGNERAHEPDGCA
jgi:hypothetical protein